MKRSDVVVVCGETGQRQVVCSLGLGPRALEHGVLRRTDALWDASITTQGVGVGAGVATLCPIPFD